MISVRGSKQCNETYKNIQSILLITGIERGDLVSVYADLEGKCRKGLTKPYDGQKCLLEMELLCLPGRRFSAHSKT